MSDVVIKGATLFESGRRFKSDLRISKGRIAEISREIAPRKADTVVSRKYTQAFCPL